MTAFQWIILAALAGLIIELDGLRRGFAYAMQRLVLSIEEIPSRLESQDRRIPAGE